MTQLSTTLLGEILRQHQQDVLSEWMQLQLEGAAARRDLISESELRQQSRDFLSAFGVAVTNGDRVEGPAWAPVREILSRRSEAPARQGFSTPAPAFFVFPLSRLLLARLGPR